MADRKYMSIMELAFQILSEKKRSITFVELFDLICAEKGINDEEKAEMISQVYSDFISSAKFIYVGDDEWDIKGRRAIDLWDKDGAYYDEYPDYEEELSLFEEDKLDDDDIDDEDEYFSDAKKSDDDDDEDESIYEDDFDEDDIEDDEDVAYEEFEEKEDDYIEDEKDLIFDEPLDDEEKDEFDDEEYNEYMDDYEEMYED